MKKHFDLVAIGTGSGASAAVSKCRAAGWQVAIVDSRPFGGTCALHAAGRVPEIDDLNLGAAAVEWDERGVKVSEFLLSVEPRGVVGRPRRSSISSQWPT